MLRIRDILVRIRIPGSDDLWLTDSAPDPAIFVIDLRRQLTIIYFYVFDATFTSFLKGKMS